MTEGRTEQTQGTRERTELEAYVASEIRSALDAMLDARGEHGE